MAQYTLYHKYLAVVTDKVVLEAPEGLTNEQVLELYLDEPNGTAPADATAERRYDLEEEVDKDFSESLEWFDDTGYQLRCDV